MLYGTMGFSSFQYCVHLLGEQTMPVYLGIRQFECHNHLLVTSRAHCDIRSRLRQLFPSEYSFDCIFVDAFDPAAVRNSIFTKLQGLRGNSIGFNLTGGTKLMFASAISAANQLKGHPFYIDAGHHDVLLLDGSFERAPLRPIESIDPFFVMNGFRIIESGLWSDVPSREARAELTRRLACAPRDIAKCQAEAARYNDSPGRPFRVQKGAFSAELLKPGQATVRCESFTYSTEAWPDLARYLSGGWFEEYCYLVLADNADTCDIQDLRLCVRVDWLEGRKSDPRFGVQELDIVATDGKRLFVGECKAGNVKSEHLAVVRSNVRTYGGVSAMGVLLALFRPHPATVRKIGSSNDCSLFTGMAIQDRLPHSLSRLEGGETHIGPIPGEKKHRGRR